MAHLMIVGEFRGEVHGQIAELRNEMRGNHTAVSAEIRRIDDKLTWALDLRERIVALETKLAVADGSRGASEFERCPTNATRPLTG